MVGSNSGEPARKRQRGIVSRDSGLGAQKYFVSGIFSGLHGVQQIPAQSKHTAMLGVIDGCKVQFRFFHDYWGFHQYGHALTTIHFVGSCEKSVQSRIMVSSQEVRWFLEGGIEEYPILRHWVEDGAVDPRWIGRLGGLPDVYLI